MMSASPQNELVATPMQHDEFSDGWDIPLFANTFEQRETLASTLGYAKSNEGFVPDAIFERKQPAGMLVRQVYLSPDGTASHPAGRLGFVSIFEEGFVVPLFITLRCLHKEAIVIQRKERCGWPVTNRFPTVVGPIITKNRRQRNCLDKGASDALSDRMTE
jgi:hypothetical protein